jgi:anti-sigma factor RsiW
MELSAFADGELDPERRLALESHLEDCEDCRTELEGFGRLASVLREADAEVLAGFPQVSLWPAIADALATPSAVLSVAPSSCEDNEVALSAYVDGELGHAQRVRLEAHLDACDHCRKQVGLYESLTSLVRGADEETFEEFPAVRLWPRLERTIGELQRPRLTDRWRSFAPAWARPVWVPLTAAAVLALTLALPLVPRLGTLQADEVIVESVEGNVMVFKEGKKSTIIMVYDR